MKHTIICCDLCNGRIYKDGFFQCEEGAISIRAKELRRIYQVDDMTGRCWIHNEGFKWRGVQKEE